MKLNKLLFVIGLISLQSYTFANSCDCKCSNLASKTNKEKIEVKNSQDKVIVEVNKKVNIDVLKNKKDELILNIKDSRCGVSYILNNEIIFEADSNACTEKLIYETEDKYGNVSKKNIEILTIDKDLYSTNTNIHSKTVEKADKETNYTKTKYQNKSDLNYKTTKANYSKDKAVENNCNCSCQK